MKKKNLFPVFLIISMLSVISCDKNINVAPLADAKTSTVQSDNTTQAKPGAVVINNDSESLKDRIIYKDEIIKLIPPKEQEEKK